MTAGRQERPTDPESRPAVEWGALERIADAVTDDALATLRENVAGRRDEGSRWRRTPNRHAHLRSALASQSQTLGRIAELRDAIEFAHEERRQCVEQGRSEETMTLFQHWSAAAGWLASRIRAHERGDEPNWPDAARTQERPMSAPDPPVTAPEPARLSQNQWWPADDPMEEVARVLSSAIAGGPCEPDDLDRQAASAILEEGLLHRIWLAGHAAGVYYQADGWNADAHDPADDSPYQPVRGGGS